jgi:pre-rRNA-processing protein TSR2
MITRLGTKVGDCDEMRLRSGHRVGVDGPAAKIPQTAAEARAMLMKDAVRMPDEHVLAFKQGLAGLLNRWTALQLAISNEWGGAEIRPRKAKQMREELEDWFLQTPRRQVRRGPRGAAWWRFSATTFACSARTGRRGRWRTIACEMFEQTVGGGKLRARDATICAKPLPARAPRAVPSAIEEDRRWTMGAGGNGNETARESPIVLERRGSDELRRRDGRGRRSRMGSRRRSTRGKASGDARACDDDVRAAPRGGDQPDPDEDGWSTVPKRGGR